MRALRRGGDRAPHPDLARLLRQFWDRELENNPIQGANLSAKDIEDYTSKTLTIALLEAASAIFLTSFTACIAFITGLATDMPAINTCAHRRRSPRREPRAKFVLPRGGGPRFSAL